MYHELYIRVCRKCRLTKDKQPSTDDTFVHRGIESSIPGVSDTVSTVGEKDRHTPNNITSSDLTTKVTTIVDAKEFPSGEASPKKWIFTSVKNKYTFEIPSKITDASDTGDNRA